LKRKRAAVGVPLGRFFQCLNWGAPGQENNAMKRILRMIVNLLLAIMAIYAAAKMLVILDAVAGWLLPERVWPGPTGIYFVPGTEVRYEMHDYVCTDRINSLGFRDRDIALDKKSRRRIVVIGDSFTYGWGVNIEDAWCKRVESRLREQGFDVEVLNLGKPGAGPRDYAGIAEWVIPRLKPDMVVVGCLAAEDLAQLGDIWSIEPGTWLRENYSHLLDLVQHVQHAWRGLPPPPSLVRTAEDVRREYANVAQDIANGFSDEQRSRFNALEESVRNVFFEGRLNPWMIEHAIVSPNYFSDMTHLRLQTSRLQQHLRRIQKAATRQGAKLVVLTIPEGFYVNKEAYANIGRVGFRVHPEMLQSNAPDRAVEKAARGAGVSAFFSVTDEFRKHQNTKGLYFELDRHMTPAGNALYAALVSPFLAEELRSLDARPPTPETDALDSGASQGNLAAMFPS